MLNFPKDHSDVERPISYKIPSCPLLKRLNLQETNHDFLFLLPFLWIMFLQPTKWVACIHCHFVQILLLLFASVEGRRWRVLWQEDLEATAPAKRSQRTGYRLSRRCRNNSIRCRIDCKGSQNRAFTCTSDHIH